MLIVFFFYSTYKWCFFCTLKTNLTCMEIRITRKVHVIKTYHNIKYFIRDIVRTVITQE